jgi:hypothetical protein
MRPLELPFRFFKDDSICMYDQIPKHIEILARICYNLEKECHLLPVQSGMFRVYYIRA